VSSRNKNPQEIDIKDQRDLFGHLPHRAWSCLILDAVDELRPVMGPKGYELYYRLAQQVEAGLSGFGGAEEARIRSIYFSGYVWHSLTWRAYILSKLR